MRKSKRVSRAERRTCPVCGRTISTFVPKGGDGSRVMLRRHCDYSLGKSGICDSQWRLFL